MISPPARHFLNSSFFNVQSLRSVEGEPWLDMHPDDAQLRGVTQGAYVRVFNDRGSVELRVRVTDRARIGLRDIATRRACEITTPRQGRG